MRAGIVIVCVLLGFTPLMAQGTDNQLRSDLEALHAKWYKAFDSGDGAAMDQMESDDLVIVMPEGSLFRKSTPRGTSSPSAIRQTARTLSDVSVRRFGDTAILTGILTSKSAKETSRDATTVVFVQSSGKWNIASAQWTPVARASRDQMFRPIRARSAMKFLGFGVVVALFAVASVHGAARAPDKNRSRAARRQAARLAEDGARESGRRVQRSRPTSRVPTTAPGRIFVVERVGRVKIVGKDGKVSCRSRFST